MRLKANGRLAFLLIALLAVLYLPAMQAPPVLDDEPEFAHVRTFNSLHDWLGKDCFQLWRPVKNLFFVLFDRLAPDRPWVWHSVSLLLLLCSTLLAKRYFSVLLGDVRWAVLAAGLWAAAPTQVAVVSWISCVNLLVMMLGVFGCLLAHEAAARARVTGRRVWLCLAGAVCLFVALASYESAVAVVPLAVVHDGFVDSRRWRQRGAHFRYALLSGVTLLYLGVRHVAGGSMQMSNDAIVAVPDWLLSASSAYFLMDHLLLWFLPFGRQYVLGTYNAHAPGTGYLLAASWVAVFVLAAGVWLCRRREPSVPFAAVWFALAFAPLSNLVPLRSGPMADYYLALPSLGLSFLVVSLARELIRLSRHGAAGSARRFLGRVGVVVLAGWGLAILVTAARWVRTWHSGEALLEQTMRARPESFRASAGLARLKAQAGHLAEAERYARASVRQAPDYIHGCYALCDVLQRTGEHAEALKALERARRLRPNDPAPLVLAGHIHGAVLGDPVQAEALYKQALALPWDLEYSRIASLNLGQWYFQTGQLTNAIQVWQAASVRMPRDPDFHQNLAIGFYKTGRLDLARQHAREAARLGSPVHPNVLALLGEPPSE